MGRTLLWLEIKCKKAQALGYHDKSWRYSRGFENTIDACQCSRRRNGGALVLHELAPNLHHLIVRDRRAIASSWCW